MAAEDDETEEKMPPPSKNGQLFQDDEVALTQAVRALSFDLSVGTDRSKEDLMFDKCTGMDSPQTVLPAALWPFENYLFHVVTTQLCSSLLKRSLSGLTTRASSSIDGFTLLCPIYALGRVYNLSTLHCSATFLERGVEGRYAKLKLKSSREKNGKAGLSEIPSLTVNLLLRQVGGDLGLRLDIAQQCGELGKYTHLEIRECQLEHVARAEVLEARNLGNISSVNTFFFWVVRRLEHEVNEVVLQVAQRAREHVDLQSFKRVVRVRANDLGGVASDSHALGVDRAVQLEDGYLAEG
ncbi:hypothetical protein GQ600_8993 [Phytophthora cactorum]|nr:hypothetical protein GQ600_8993 [Phytophthora cactorum]